MCGLYGWQLRTNRKGQPLSPERRAVLAFVLGSSNDARGGHSWGWYAPKAKVHRRGLGKVTNVVRKAARFDSLIGHTRWGTTGENTVENAHPFIMGDGKLVGAHNGIIYNHRDLNEKHGRTFQVDSQHIFQHLLDGKDLGELEGYGTVTYAYTEEPGTIYMARMTESAQLAVASNEYGTIWSSDGKHLKEALAAAGLKASTYYEVDVGKRHFVRDGKFLINSEVKVAISDGGKMDWRTMGEFDTGSRYDRKWKQTTGGGWVMDDDDDNVMDLADYMDKPSETNTLIDPLMLTDGMSDEEIINARIMDLTTNQYRRWMEIEGFTEREIVEEMELYEEELERERELIRGMRDAEARPEVA